ncbi:biosynthetic-type acetolactate synthase large subunit [Enterococcus cecorum]|uniref:biosynthetic-type acetolactate synthase large subunit n=1 Tax=Enterococcus cecorum TaxID=44008 RepID=UPI000760D59F|nr:biosynthetic-type acetolactate synthase large subunit [Enterococcus cecorum]MCJ0572217.1 biosynthetic-type acetolactate synthase large subunit [Enterococcus cecorum]MCJ0577863.1 biosynthetic-type acetolactate synthase large subunit [Enterococcus cecorum]MCJ0582891.1 biosynthetic-type acetolactate synthase large subunit [Enterococcus cecorum]MCJ0585144.1 biosynthetic-type acetolactate synthase large subunit [Enterococcus cecorum]MCJ0590602.1 biosynthetic-type acetolactate synthase large subu
MENQTKLNGSELLLECLKKEKVELIFGYPGGAVLPLYDAMYDFEIPNVLTRHEQGAVHAAEGYAKVTGKPGVVVVTSGPGATNAITGIADAMSDSLPLVVITGQVGTGGIGTDAFQEADILGITLPITKHNFQVRDVNDLQRIVHEAFHIASTGRPGPVVIDLPKDISQSMGGFLEHFEVDIPSYQPNTSASLPQIEKVMKQLKRAKKPLLLVGAGVSYANATEELRTFVDKYQIPVVETMMALGTVPSKHPLNLGMGGMHGTYAANMALSTCDYLINIGSRFADRLATSPNSFAPNAKIAHIDIDPAEIGKVIRTDIPVVADAKDALEKMLALDTKPGNYSEWIAECQEREAKHPLYYDETDEEIKPQRVVEIVGEITDSKAYVVTDVGQHQMWVSQFYPFSFPRQMITSGGLGTMGYGIPAGIGVKFAHPESQVVVFVGDGGFQMTNQEFAILNEHNLDIKFVLMNNHVLGMVHQWQEKFHGARFSSSEFKTQPDFMKLAEAYHVKGVRLSNPKTIEEDLKAAFALEGPVLIEVEIPAQEHVLPMVAAGAPNHKMIGVK